MRTSITLAALLLALLFGSNPVLAQKATEFFIPVGQSPGLSLQETWLGVVETVDEENNVLTITNESGTRNINLTPETQIWLDKSLVKEPNETGDLTDLQAGLTIEVKYRSNEPSESAEWIKVRVEP